MKNFIYKTLIFAIILFLFYIIIWSTKIIKTNNINWTLKKEVTTVFMGASHPLRGINPEFYPNSVNISSSSERYMFTYLKLKKILKYNNIDTLFLEFAPTDIWENSDIKYFDKNEMQHFIPLYSPMFSKEEFIIYKKNIYDAFSTFVSKIFKLYPKDIFSYGGYEPTDKEFSPCKPSVRPKWDIYYGNSVNLKYLDKILNLCNINRVKVYLIYFPMYEPNRFYNLNYFYKVYQEKYSQYEFLDYNSIFIPNSFRADENHLNSKGAEYFTKLLYNEIHK